MLLETTVVDADGVAPSRSCAVWVAVQFVAPPLTFMVHALFALTGILNVKPQPVAVEDANVILVRVVTKDNVEEATESDPIVDVVAVPVPDASPIVADEVPAYTHLKLRKIHWGPIFV